MKTTIQKSNYRIIVFFISSIISIVIVIFGVTVLPNLIQVEDEMIFIGSMFPAMFILFLGTYPMLLDHSPNLIEKLGIKIILILLFATSILVWSKIILEF